MMKILKEIEFKPNPDDPRCVVAETVFGCLHVSRIKCIGWFLEVGDVGGDCSSIEDGIRKATEWYESQIRHFIIDDSIDVKRVGQ